MEDKDKNFSDDGPRSLAHMEIDIQRRQGDGESIYCVLLKREPIGVIAHKPVVAGAMERFNGICFAEKVHGTGIPLEAVSLVLERIFNTGVGMVAAAYFADNARVEAFLKKLGATYSTVGGSARRNGVTVDTKQSMIHVDRFWELRSGKAMSAQEGI